MNRRAVRVVPSFYRLSEELARTVAELPLYCQEHLVDGEAGWLPCEYFGSCERISEWVGYQYDTSAPKQTAENFETTSENNTWQFVYH